MKIMVSQIALHPTVFQCTIKTNKNQNQTYLVGKCFSKKKNGKSLDSGKSLPIVMINENTVGTYKKKTMHLFRSNGQMVKWYDNKSLFVLLFNQPSAGRSYIPKIHMFNFTSLTESWYLSWLTLIVRLIYWRKGAVFVVVFFLQ